MKKNGKFPYIFGGNQDLLPGFFFRFFISLLKPRYFIKLTDFNVNIIKILLVAILNISKLKVKYLFFYPVLFPNFQNVTKLTVGNGFTSFTEISTNYF